MRDLFPPGTVLMGVAYDRLVAKALAGDEKSIRILARLAPQDLPLPVVRAIVYPRIRDIAARLMADHKIAPHTAARILLDLGARATNRRKVKSAWPLPGLSLAEMTDTEGEVRDLAEQLPHWPSLRTLDSIVTDRSKKWG